MYRQGRNAPDPSPWVVHGRLHREIPAARVILHCHSAYGTTLASLEETTLLPIDNNTARFWGRVGYNLEFNLNSDSAAEGAHLTQAMEDNTVLACATTASQ
ncbi:class II aldolase/adducin family protein [uncultured Sulfitobacter sp.]|uniref:class II aldolase/adducin family protein n=1 Tax=uncultured Sulfitobacter sp. TaxID=191468 RepID=UPI00338E8102